MPVPASFLISENWELIRKSNPFTQHLQCIDKCLLTDDAFEAPLPLQGKHVSGCLSEQNYLECYQVVWPDIQLVALVGQAYEICLQPSKWISLILVTAGEVCIVQGGLRWCARAGSCLVVPGQEMYWSSQAFSVVCVMIPWNKLGNILETLKANTCSTGEFTVVDNPKVCVLSRDEFTSQITSLFNCTLEAIGKLQDYNFGLVKHLDLVEHLYRLFTVLISRPCLERPIEVLQASPLPLRDSFDELLEYMQSNLDQPLNLSVLESKSNYSKRALQYAFRNRMGCTATQWVRSSRLELAYQLILKGTANESVASVAMACGYRSMGLFSIEFQQRFHIKPSHLLRSSQSELPFQAPSDDQD